MDNEAQMLLDDAIDFCRRDGLEARLINMLSQSQAIRLTEETLTVQAPSRFAHTYLEKQRATIEGYLEQIAFAPIALELVAEGAAASPIEPSSPQAPEPAPATRPSDATVRPAAPGASMPPISNAREQAGASAEDTLAQIRAAAAAARAAMGQQEAEPPATTANGWQAAPHPGRAPLGAAGGARQVRINNTMSPKAFQAMIGREAEPAAPAVEQASEKPAESAGAAVGVMSKFTFENFVSGAENMHAYRSAQYFAALADEPGQYTNLFIYGNSGLGKTHLLFAIKNYIEHELPGTRVKYANSQSYLNDYMRNLGLQRKPGEMIMSEYRDADVLIIDDIQNIVGKQASVEFFFQLVDEFMRTGKKLAIASDRAPKKLGMDERLTSRFNAGMLCLVAEPSYEMKYKILQRYYENTIVAAPEAGDDSLLAAYGGDSGHLTDEHFKHMAEVSGTNIRELESFCERCAGEAGDREREGGELTFDDIDAIASQYFDTSAKKINVQTVQSVIEEQYGVTHEELIGPRRNANIAKARHIAIYLAIEMCEMTTTAVGAEFGNRNHSTVSTSYKKVQKMIQEDRTVTEDLKSLRDKITLRS